MPGAAWRRMAIVAALATGAAPLAAQGPPPAPAAVAPPAATTLADTSRGDGARVPGTALRFGDGYARVRRDPALGPTAAPEAAPGEAYLAGRLRFFGVDGSARLAFSPDGLARVAWKTSPIAPHQRDYVEDQLRRMGYRPRCERYDDRMRECDWIGALTVHVKSDTGGMVAEILRPGESAPRAYTLPTDEERARAAEDARLAPFLADPAPILDDTLSIDPEAVPGRRSPPMVQQAFPPEYPDALRDRGITGIVHVLALVGLNGRVSYARTDDGPTELRPIARETVMRYRFAGYVEAGKPVRFWVWIPVRFGV